MKKFILPLLLLLAFGMLAAVESEPSAVVGYVKYICLAGDNVIALPMQLEYEWASELGDAIGAGNLGYFDSTSKEWVLIDKQPWVGGGWTDDFELTNGQVLWAYFDDDTDYYSLGNLPTAMPHYTLLAGDNVIMLPLDKSDLDFASLVGDEIGAGNMGYFDSTSKEWVLIDKQPWVGGGWTDEFDTTIGMPLWTYVDEDGTWPPIAAKTTKNVKTQIRSK